MKRLQFFGGFVLSLLAVLTANHAFAQTLTSATIVGVITDASGAVVPKASVTIVQIDTGATSTSTSTSTGEYRFPFINPGTYEIKATAGSLEALPLHVQVLVGQEK